MMELKQLLCCVSLFTAYVSATQTFHDIRDLNQTEFGHNYPRHGLMLLYWLAGHIDIDQTDNILLKFNPERQDYGFQPYTNDHQVPKLQKEALPPLSDSLDRAYFSLGSLSSVSVRTKLPPYVTQDFYNSPENLTRDLDRVVVRVQRSNPTRADKVYVAQAVSNQQGSSYDLDQTFEISPNLLRQIQVLQKHLDLMHALETDMFGLLNFTEAESDKALARLQLLSQLRQGEKHLKTIYKEPGLKLFLSLAGYNTEGRYAVHKKTWSCSEDDGSVGDKGLSQPETLCEGQRPLKIEVTSSEDGYARLKWTGLPKNIMKQEVIFMLFSGDSPSMFESFESPRGQTSGSSDTFVALKHGLQPCLITYSFATDHSFDDLQYTVFWRGPQFDDANRMIPTEIGGYKASLQLYTNRGYACARLYIKKSFADWKTEFEYAWVGFYSSQHDSYNQYKDYQWASKFKKAEDQGEYLIYQFKSSMSIAPGVQIRCMFEVRPPLTVSWDWPIVKARSVPWEKEDN